MAKRIAVITDATSADYFFPAWARYYGGLFGPDHLYVVTYNGTQKQFAGHRLGGVFEMNVPYSDVFRASAVSEIVALLFAHYDAVIRCDVDEFLVAHPLRHASLASYVQALARPYVTARGFDVVEYDDDAPLRLDGSPLLAQRSYAVGRMSLHKTAIVTAPVKWSIGFHHADVPPRLDDLFLMHMKFADIKGRAAWFAHMRAASRPGSFEDTTYANELDKIQASRNALVRLPRRDGWAAFEDEAFANRYLASVERNGSFYAHPFDMDTVARRIPDAMRDIV